MASIKHTRLSRPACCLRLLLTVMPVLLLCVCCDYCGMLLLVCPVCVVTPCDVIRYADNISKCMTVLKPNGHLSHIQNLGSDKDRVQAMAQAHAEGKSQQSAFHVLVAPNGPQLEEVYGLMAAGKVKLEVAKVGEQAYCTPCRVEDWHVWDGLWPWFAASLGDLRAAVHELWSSWRNCIHDALKVTSHRWVVAVSAVTANYKDAGLIFVVCC